MTHAARQRDNRPVLDARGLGVRFPARGGAAVTALDGFTVSARRGEVTGFVGPDGAGKTTLLRAAVGLVVPTAGTLTVLGLDATRDIDVTRGRIGYMPQRFGLYEDLTVEENLDLYADLQSVPRGERAERYRRLMSMTGLGDFKRRQAGRLSGGMKQKLGLACCLVKSPHMLVLDEPTVGVDPVSRRDLWQIVYELVERDRIGVVLSTAYLDEAERCHHVVLMHQGRLLDQGPPAEFHGQVDGRVYRVEPASGRHPRDIQAALSRRADVLDATLHSGRIRVLLTPDAGRPTALAPGDAARVVAARPVFEDAFVSRLAAEGFGRHPAGAESPDEASPGGDVPGNGGDGETAVSVDGLRKAFGGFTAVSDIGFAVRRGEIFGLLGANGAGKTTTFRMLCGLLPASGGRIRVAGHDLRRSPAEARSRIGYMAQKFSLYQQLPVSHNLRFYGRAYGLSRGRLRSRIDQVIAEFELGDWRDRPTGELPGGYRQRLAMAVAMLHEPDILFLDEPTSGADPHARREFWLRINGFARAGVTVVVTTHFMEEAEFCDHMLIMSQGTALAQGTPDEIRHLSRTADNPEPSMEDAFIDLAEGRVTPEKEEPARG